MNERLKTQVLSLLICIALLMTTVGCGNKDDNNNQIGMVSPSSANASNYRLEKTSYALPESMSISTAQCVVGDRIYLGGIGKSSMLGYINADGSEGKLFALPDDYEFVYAICEVKGNIAVLCGDYPYSYLDAGGKLVQNLDPNGKLALLLFSPDGELLDETPLTNKYTDIDMNFKLMLFKDECFVLMSQSYLIKISADGEELGRIPQGEGVPFSSMCLINGNIILSRGDIASLKSQICSLDLGSFTLNAKAKLNESVIIGIGVSADGKLLVNDAFGGGGSVSYFDISRGETERVFSWDDLGIAHQSIKLITGLKNGFLYYEPYQDAVYMAEFVKDEDKRTELILATDTIRPELSELVEGFNSKNKDYKIKIVEYGNGNDKTIDLLYTELITGNAPDIFAFYNYTFENAESSGAFENLLTYLDNDSEYSRESIIPSLMDALSRNDKMYWLPYDFSITTFIVQQSVVGERTSITMEEAESFASGLGDDISVFPSWVSKSNLLGWMISFAATRFIDEASGTCYFNNPDFIALLEKCNAQPGDETTVPSEGKSLLYREYLQSFAVYKGLQMGYSENYRFVGFPTDEGNGSTFDLNLRLGISSQSKLKDGAWTFVRSTMSNENQQNTGFFPVIQSVMDSQIELGLKGELVDIDFGKIKLYQSDVDKLNALIKGTTELSGRNETIYAIIREEAAAYFAGDKTVEECASLIQNRASIYLAEQK